VTVVNPAALQFASMMPWQLFPSLEISRPDLFVNAIDQSSAECQRPEWRVPDQR
jgi:hypothetical protein